MLPRCIITANCNGRMSQVKKLFVADGQYHSINTSNVTWSQRPLIYVHTQTAPRSTWVVQHNLGNVPILTVYVTDLSGNLVIANKTSYTITTNSNLTSTIAFNTATSGCVECIIRQFTARTISSDTGSSNMSNLTLTPNLSLVLASKLPITSIEITVNSHSEKPVTLYTDTSMLAVTPWSNIKYVIIDNERYAVYAINMTGLSTIANVVTSFYISKLNGAPTTSKNTYILLSDVPYLHPTDRNISDILDISVVSEKNQNLLSIVDRVLYASPQLIRTVYPLMDPIT